MEKVTDNDNQSFVQSNKILNKLPPWLVEMTENVKKLKSPVEDIHFLSSEGLSSDERRFDPTILSSASGVTEIDDRNVKKLKSAVEDINFLSSEGLVSDERCFDPTILSSASGVTEIDDRVDDAHQRLPFVVEAPDVVGGCIILQPCATTSLPNTPKEGYEFARTISALSAFSLPDTNENEFLNLDKYLDNRDLDKGVDLDSETKNWDKFSYSESKSDYSQWKQQHSFTTMPKKSIEILADSLSTADIQSKNNRRISRQQQISNSKPFKNRIPPYKATNNQSSERNGVTPNLPIGIIRRRQDYLAGVASRGETSADVVSNNDEKEVGNELRIDTRGTGQAPNSMRKKVGDYRIAEKVAQLNLQASRKPNLNGIVKKNVQADLSEGGNKRNPLLSRSRRPLYDNERSPPQEDNSHKDFIIPELPRGKTLAIDILTTWGDKHYVGLNGIEIFSDVGESVIISDIWADPTDINVLPEYNKDPRIVSNLINGINQTTDDYNLWLAPYTSGEHHFIHMTFETTVNVAMIRIWNYNKSRIHSYRGVKDVKITLDDVLIFDGEIARASGGVFGNVNCFGDTILFTTDEHILESISKHDATYSFAMECPESPRNDIDRPITTDTGEERPLTCASSNRSNSTSCSSNTFLYVCKEVELLFTANWGHPSLIGLCGIELIGDQDSAIPLTQASISCDIGNENLHRLTDRNNLTTETNHMWAVNFMPGDTVAVTIAFQTEISLAALRIWNYNGSLDLSYCGAKRMFVKLDGKSVCNRQDGFTLRRAPGCCHYDYVQEINFANQSTASKPSRRPVIFDALSKAYICIDTDYEAPMMPQGFVYQLIIFSTWGDPYYVGLTGIQMFDSNGYLIQLTKDNIAAYPESVNVIEGVDNDVRTPDKLVDGVNDTADGHHMWLAPILPNQTNRVYVIFDSPITVSMIKLWNYKKTLQRGVKEFGILVDDLLVYNGVLNTNIPYGTVVFNGNKDGASENHSLTQSAQIGEDIKLLNLERRATSGGDCYADPLLRPHTSLMQTSLRSNTTSNM